MHAINIKKLEKVVLSGHIIIKFSVYFNIAIFGKKKSSVDLSENLEKLGQEKSK